MTENEARDWVAARWGGAAVDRLGIFAAAMVAENERQNLVSAASLSVIWSRHIADSAQLVPLGEDRSGWWADIGSGGGFPGLVVAVLRPEPTLLVEPRARRATFLSDVAAAMQLTHVRVATSRVEVVEGVSASIISARAVAAPTLLFDRCAAIATPDTRYLLPRGRDAENAIEEAQQRWRGVFHVEHSVTDPTSGIIVADKVQRR